MSSPELHDVDCLALFVSAADGDGWTAGVVPEDSSDVSALAVDVRRFAGHNPIQPKFSEGVACVVSKSQS